MINGYLKTSFVDYPGRICAVIFFGGCNFRCPYCHNPGLVNNTEPEYSFSLIEKHLEERKGLIEAVTITGGEPTLYSDLVGIIKKLKERNLLVKLDTNGSNPKMLRELIENKMIDYVAIDIKAPFSKYEKVIKTKVNADLIRKSVEILINSDIDYEFRTTVHSELINEDDLLEIANDLTGARKWCLQVFMNYNEILDKSYMENNHIDMRKLEIIAEKIKNLNLINEIVVR
jgi:pyruvate formate lyase activating enzyme